MCELIIREIKPFRLFSKSQLISWTFIIDNGFCMLGFVHYYYYYYNNNNYYYYYYIYIFSYVSFLHLDVSTAYTNVHLSQTVESIYCAGVLSKRWSLCGRLLSVSDSLHAPYCVVWPTPRKWSKRWKGSCKVKLIVTSRLLGLSLIIWTDWTTLREHHEAEVFSWALASRDWERVSWYFEREIWVLVEIFSKWRMHQDSWQWSLS